MADNVNVETGFSAVVASDDVGGAQYQRMKIGIGSDGEAVDLQPASYSSIATIDGDVSTLLQAPAVFYGYSFRAVGGAASVVIRDGDADTSAIVIVINLLSGESVRDWFGPQGIRLFNGSVYVQQESGTVEGAYWHSQGVIM